MTNIEKIRQEIERRAKFHDNAMKACPGLNNIALTHSAGWKEDTELLSFIDSLPEEKPSEDLEEAAREWTEAHYKDSVSQQVCADDFITGAKWQQEQPKVNLKKEIKEWVDLMVGASFPEQDGDFISEEDYRSVIRQTAIHFLSLNTRKDE